MAKVEIAQSCVFGKERKVSSLYFKMANDNLQSVVNVNTQVRCKQSIVMYIPVNKELLRRHFARGTHTIQLAL